MAKTKQLVTEGELGYAGNCPPGCLINLSKKDPLGLVGLLRNIAEEISASTKRPTAIERWQTCDCGCVPWWHEARTAAFLYAAVKEGADYKAVFGFQYGHVSGTVCARLYENRFEQIIKEQIKLYEKTYPTIKISVLQAKHF